MSTNLFARMAQDMKFKDLYVGRPHATQKLVSLYRNWRDRPDPLSLPAKVVTICGDGLTGKTSFLERDAKRGLKGVERKKKGSAPFYYVYCDLDAGRRREVREIEALLRIRNALNGSSVLTPMLDRGLRRYDVLTHGGLSRFGSSSMSLPEELLDKVAEGAVDAFTSPVDSGVIKMAVKGMAKEARSIYKQKTEQSQAEKQWKESLQDSLGTPDLNEVYSKFPALLAKDMDSVRGRICLVIDSFEVLYREGEQSSCPKWVEMLAGKPNLFLIISGRRVPERFDLAKHCPFDLGSVSRDEFSRELIKRGLNEGDAKKISRLCDRVPGLGVVLARTGLEDGKFPTISPKKLNQDSREIFEVLKDALIRQLVAMDNKTVKQLKAMSWIGAWQGNRVPSIPMLSEFDEGAIVGLNYVSKVGRGGYAIHSLVASALREICDRGFIREFENQVHLRMDDKGVSTEEVSALTQALTSLAGHRVRNCVRTLCRKGILSSNPLDETVSLSGCGDILDLIGVMDYSFMDSDARDAVDSYLEALQGYSEMELRYALLYEFVDPTFSFQHAQDAIDVCKRIVEFASTWFRRTMPSPDGDERRAAVVLDYAGRLRKFAAIATEMYKLTSDFSYQVNSMQYELEAAESIIGHVVEKGSLVSPTDLTLLCNMLNALSISQYRLRRYDVSLPLREICCSLIESHSDAIEGEARARALRSGATAYLAYARDYSSEGTCHVATGEHPPINKLASDVPGALDRAKELCRLSLGVNDTWSARITLADCTFEQAVQGIDAGGRSAQERYAEAIDGLEAVRVDIVHKNQKRHPEYARCMQRLAFAYESASAACLNQRMEYLQKSLECCEVAEGLLLERHQSDEHVDVIKVRELMDSVKRQLAEF